MRHAFRRSQRAPRQLPAERGGKLAWLTVKAAKGPCQTCTVLYLALDLMPGTVLCLRVTWFCGVKEA
ncbi:Scm-Like With Four Mbt Domains Protein 1 [Manis pentadactyla]|nr:Scm-Like With Four Mbt Domains Protein 1 [Manis pentadactyla]